jgi:histidinol-phosphate phosphatase family protein
VNRFVLLDRDGTLTRDAGYTHRIADYALLPGVVEGLRRLAAAGFRFAIATNQSGIGRGIFSEADYQAFQCHLTEDLGSRGIRIEASFHCPHRPEAGCACRKPAPGLFFAARDALRLDLGACWAIGDQPRDVEAALAAGCKGAILVHPDGGFPAAADEILTAEGLTGTR